MENDGFRFCRDLTNGAYGDKCGREQIKIRTGTVIIFHDNESTYFFKVERWQYELLLNRLNGADKFIYFAGKDSTGAFRDLTMRRKWVGAIRWEEN